ncbi:MAG: alcohol dehydrogenase catalytic domain-containing protein [Pseudomonadota bacterium]
MSTRCIAAVIDGFGTMEQLVLRELTLPAPRPGEVLVQVQAASVNPIDVRRRTGYGRRLLGLMGAGQPPIVLGNDFAGVVRAVGRGVTTLREGDAVFGAKPPSANGSHACHVIVKAGHAVLQDTGLDAPSHAILPYNYLTVRRALAGAGLDASSARARPVLVYGASGGLGLLAIRMLHAMGAEVTAVASHAFAECRAAGALHLVDRRVTPLHKLESRFAATLNFANWDDDAALLRLLATDALGHATTVHPLMAHIDAHGLLLGALRAMRNKRQMRSLLPQGARYDWTVFRPDPAAMPLLRDFAAQDRAAPAIQCYRLDQVGAAHRHVSARLPGRAVLLPQQH